MLGVACLSHSGDGPSGVSSIQLAERLSSYDMIYHIMLVGAGGLGGGDYPGGKSGFTVQGSG